MKDKIEDIIVDIVNKGEIFWETFGVAIIILVIGFIILLFK